MNIVEINNSEIELIFENCESIHIDIWAVEQMHFTTKDEYYEFDATRKNLMKKINLKSFYLKLNLNDEKMFHHTARLIDKNTTIKQDGEKCIDRLRYCDDITHVYINGICYSVPWQAVKQNFDGIPCYKNTLQKNEETTNKFNNKVLILKVGYVQ